LPYAMAVRANMSVTVRTKSSPESLIPLVRQTVAGLDKDLPLADMTMMDEYVATARLRTRFITSLCGALTAVGLLLSCVGIYGLTSSIASKRTKEIGIRMALGAQRRDIATMVLRKTMGPVMLGGLIGFGLSLALMPLLSSLLYGVHPTDPAVLVVVLLFLSFVGLAASSLPTQRAVRKNPVSALRWE
jgi:ABC-type antimicrobial peptide transport system permease subunit